MLLVRSLHLHKINICYLYNKSINVGSKLKGWGVEGLNLQNVSPAILNAYVFLIFARIVYGHSVKVLLFVEINNWFI